MEKASVPNNPHVVLHRNGHFGASVIFQNRHIDPNIRIQNCFVHLSRLQAFTFWQIHILVIRFFVGRKYLCSGSFGCCFDTAIGIAFSPVVAGMIKNNNFFCSCFKTLRNNFGHQFGIGIGCQFRLFVPTDIRFHHHLISFFYELRHSAHFGYAFSEHIYRRSAHYSHKVVSSGCRKWSSIKMLSQKCHCTALLYCERSSGQCQ